MAKKGKVSDTQKIEELKNSTLNTFYIMISAMVGVAFITYVKNFNATEGVLIFLCGATIIVFFVSVGFNYFLNYIYNRKKT